MSIIVVSVLCTITNAMKSSNLKPVLETISPEFGSSFTIKHYNQSNLIDKPYWHCHAGYEIVYISNGKGRRQVGDHNTVYCDGDLVFLGPNLPHIGLANGVSEAYTEVAVQMETDFLGKDFFLRPEMEGIRQLFRRAEKGLSFYGDTKLEIGSRLKQLPDRPSFSRLIELLQILDSLSQSTEYKPLNAKGISLEVGGHELSRIQVVYDYISKNYQNNISLEEVAKEVNMTVPAFCRFIKKGIDKTFTQLVNEFRIAEACRLLSEEHLTIANVGFECGFNNLSHFNKQFKLITGSSPSDYRRNKNIVL